MIQISESAAKKIAALKMEENKSNEAVLRVQVKRGGCSGFSYKMDFADAPQATKFLKPMVKKSPWTPRAIYT